MNQDWQGALVRRLLLLLGGCLLLGLISGEYAWALVLGLSGYLIWTLRQLLRLPLPVRYRRRPALLEAWAVKLLRYLSSCTLVLEKRNTYR